MMFPIDPHAPTGSDPALPEAGDERATAKFLRQDSKAQAASGEAEQVGERVWTITNDEDGIHFEPGYPPSGKYVPLTHLQEAEATLTDETDARVEAQARLQEAERERDELREEQRRLLSAVAAALESAEPKATRMPGTGGPYGDGYDG